MTTADVLDSLRSCGTEQNRKIYARHGSGDRCLGVSFAEVEKLRKRIKSDHPLAVELWQSGIFEARSLATMIAEPARMTAADLESWVEDIDNHSLAGLFARNVASKSRFAKASVDAWSGSPHELIAETGYQVLACLASPAPAASIEEKLTDSYFESWLVRIEAEIHTSRNRVRHAMNSALIAIGSRNDRLRQAALAAAGRIGKVTVDHGDTACKTPDAVAYIHKTAARQAAKKAKQK
ncbi:MAG: DNA alkylation repair protein [Acidobacteriota bacterium]|nr:DNA alkylation repair protein [Acidobacteriota bacterium]